MVKGQSKSKVLQNHERRAIKDWPVSERPREKLIKLGPEGLSDGKVAGGVTSHRSHGTVG